MKRRIIVMLIATMCLSITACGNKSGELTEADIENMDEKEIEEILEAMDEDSTIKGDANETSSEEIVISEEIVNTEMFGNKIQINNTVITLPCKFEDILNAGGTILGNESPEDLMKEESEKKYSNWLL